MNKLIYVLNYILLEIMYIYLIRIMTTILINFNIFKYKYLNKRLKKIESKFCCKLEIFFPIFIILELH
jgi:hypothetical protein